MLLKQAQNKVLLGSSHNHSLLLLLMLWAVTHFVLCWLS